MWLKRRGDCAVNGARTRSCRLEHDVRPSVSVTAMTGRIPLLGNDEGFLPRVNATLLAEVKQNVSEIVVPAGERAVAFARQCMVAKGVHLFSVERAHGRRVRIA